MSHFSLIKTKLKDIKIIQKAVADLGYSCSAGPDLEIRDYNDNLQTVDIAIKIGTGYEIGLKRNIKTESYDIVADWYGIKTTADTFLNGLKQRYAFHKIVKEAENNGLMISENTQLEDGSIKLIIRQWS